MIFTNLHIVVNNGPESIGGGGEPRVPMAAPLSDTRVQKKTLNPNEFELLQNYPNPFNPVTTLPFSIQQDTFVELDIYNTKGQHIRTLLNNRMSAGEHAIIWDGRANTGERVASGVFVVQMKSGNRVLSQKIALIQ